eukprot:TRINITY_DN3583_c0_g1_i6.p1 TRINITY_DN3583_c0_g1~~TRINITY_DN3583_c0_g1_i6.p1  ORF type:complete len:187 (-),score=32.18 TRINITY_DN3583_c0_g1_i6:135-695(-)
MAFSEKGNLKRHLKVHDNTKAFAGQYPVTQATITNKPRDALAELAAAAEAISSTVPNSYEINRPPAVRSLNYPAPVPVTYPSPYAPPHATPYPPNPYPYNYPLMTAPVAPYPVAVTSYSMTSYVYPPPPYATVPMSMTGCPLSPDDELEIGSPSSHSEDEGELDGVEEDDLEAREVGRDEEDEGSE